MEGPRRDKKLPKKATKTPTIRTNEREDNKERRDKKGQKVTKNAINKTKK